MNQYLREFRRIDESFEAEEEFLQALHNLNLLSRINGEYAPTIAGMILFGNDPKKYLSQSIAQAVCFKGKNESNDIIVENWRSWIWEQKSGLLFLIHEFIIGHGKFKLHREGIGFKFGHFNNRRLWLSRFFCWVSMSRRLAYRSLNPTYAGISNISIFLGIRRNPTIGRS